VTALVDFLLARITEERQLADHAEDVWLTIGPDLTPRDGTAHGPDDWMKRSAFDLNINPWFIQKQCDAKLRMVELAQRYDRWFGAGRGDFASMQAKWATMNHALNLLALPYADHPDYRKEWRP
jgi:hypothetical protein